MESHGEYLNWDGMVEETAQITIDASAYAYAQDENPCMHVDAMLVDNAANRKMCKDFLELPLSEQETCETSKIPKTVYSVSADDDVSLTQKGLQAVNPEYEFRHFGDVSAEAFVRENCGDVVADAYSCLAPAAYRADLFRFCALHSQGGVYLDADILPLVALEELYDPCAVASVGHDFPQGRSQKQMKILAGQAGAPVFRCMLDKIVDNVRSRFYPDNALALTGPMVLEDCYTAHPENISVTYRDTRNAAYPYSGMSADDALLAFEVPVAHRDYQEDLLDHEVYRTTCPLHRASHVKAVAANSV